MHTLDKGVAAYYAGAALTLLLLADVYQPRPWRGQLWRAPLLATSTV